MKNIVIKINIFVLLAFLLVACGEETPPEELLGYSYVSYEDVSVKTSSQKDDIYIQGKLKKCYIENIDSIPYLVADIACKDGDWKFIISQLGLCSDEILSEYIGDTIRCFGDFYNMEDNCAVLKVDTSSSLNELVFSILKPERKQYYLHDLVASNEYISNCVDSKANKDGYYACNKTPGTYKSKGVVETDYETIFTFIEKKDDGFASNIIYSDYSDNNSETLLKTLTKTYNNGDAVSIYYVIDEDCDFHLLGFEDATVSYSYEEAKAGSIDYYEIASETCNSLDYGSIDFKLIQFKEDKSYKYIANAVLDSTDNAEAVFGWMIMIFYDYDFYEITLSIKDTDMKMIYIVAPSSSYAYSYEEDGTRTSGYPSWFDMDYATSDEGRDNIFMVSETFRVDYQEFLNKCNNIN